MSNECTLTTIDNPYNPFEQFNQWLMFDKANDYDTCEYLARIVQPRLTDDMTQKEENDVIEAAVDEIIATNPIPIYKKVYRDSEIKAETLYDLDYAEENERDTQ